MRANTSGRIERRTQSNEDRQTAVEVWATIPTGPTEIHPAARIASDNRWKLTDGAMAGKKEGSGLGLKSWQPLYTTRHHEVPGFF